LDGGVFYFSATTSVVISATKTTFQNNIAGFSGTGGNGGVFAVYAATTNVDLTLLSCTVNTNKNLGGQGGFFYVGPTAGKSTFTITST
jgi:hypothetical protein